MLTISLALAGVAAVIHVVFFVLESVLFMREEIYRGFLVGSREEAQAQRLFALNQGFYNLFLAVGCGVGIVLAAGNEVGIYWVLVAFCCVFMVAAAVVLVASERRMVRAATLQGVAPAIALALMLLGS